MDQTLKFGRTERALWVPAALGALLLVLFLFFIDEGYYDLRWMRSAGNWFMFLVYLAFVTPVQWLLAGLLTRLARRPLSMPVLLLWMVAADAVILALTLWIL